jgi:predicted phosphodiesterase
MKNVLVMGDIHAEWGRVNILINKKHEEIGTILQCGDFGYWPNFHNKSGITGTGVRYTFDNYGLKNKGIPIYFCDGNHENHPALLEGDKELTNRNINYMKRGTYLTLEDGRNVLFMGGAKSIDKKYRLAGHDWFPEESITERDIYALPDVKIDIVISHTCPKKFPITYERIGFHEFEDDNRDKLDYVLTKYKPALWFCGHFHKYQTGMTKGCRWTALDMVGGGDKWWAWLPN